jgi:hypothetical protein
VTSEWLFNMGIAIMKALMLFASLATGGYRIGLMSESGQG